ncbi:MAG: hypothetical protein J3T61_00705 [Candidatus Brocadiales bacterium]|nr:hypothetical protein [Candidatus Bathyanammoxibius sp.]
MYSLREGFKSFLKRTGLLPAALWLRRWMRIITNPTFRRRERVRRQQFLHFERHYASALRHRLNKPDSTQKRALVISAGSLVELGLIKGLELAGFKPVVLTWRDPWLERYYGLTGSAKLLFWDGFTDSASPAEATAAFDRLQSFEDLLALEYAGTRVGRFAAATTLRDLRLGSLDLQSPQIRKHLERYVALAMKYAVAAREIIRQVKPQVALFVDRGYTTQGELFDVCLSEGVDTITWNNAHKSNTLMLKRYTLKNRDEHPASLSEESWRLLRTVEWTNHHRQRLQQELYNSYASGDWYSEVGTQFNKRIMDADEIRRRLGLDPEKKTAVIFPHILWDGTFFYGNDLFRNYEEWLVETVRAACANDHLNWIIKIHPANVVKNVRDGIQGDPSEVIALQKHIGQLPPHIFFVPADSEINTFSFFELMDYCLTVRGTIGMEAASFGIPVLTAGTGRYDHRGFTIDPGSREQHIEKMARIQEIPPLSAAERELAERFAYGVLVSRPLHLTTVTLEYERDARATSKTRINVATREEWLNAPDLRAFAGWVADSTSLDFLQPIHPIHPK